MIFFFIRIIESTNWTLYWDWTQTFWLLPHQNLFIHLKNKLEPIRRTFLFWRPIKENVCFKVSSQLVTVHLFGRNGRQKWDWALLWHHSHLPFFLKIGLTSSTLQQLGTLRSDALIKISRGLVSSFNVSRLLELNHTPSLQGQDYLQIN